MFRETCVQTGIIFSACHEKECAYATFYEGHGRFPFVKKTYSIHEKRTCAARRLCIV